MIRAWKIIEFDSLSDKQFSDHVNLLDAIESFLLSLKGSNLMKEFWTDEVWWNKDWCWCKLVLALLLDAQMQLRRWSSCSGGRRNAFPGWWMIQRLNFINSLAFLDVLAISRVYHQSLHHLDAAQTVEGGQHRRGWMHLQRLINDSNGIRSFKHLASIGSVRLDFAQDLKLLEEIYIPFYSKVCQTKQH